MNIGQNSSLEIGRCFTKEHANDHLHFTTLSLTSQIEQINLKESNIQFEGGPWMEQKVK